MCKKSEEMKSGKFSERNRGKKRREFVSSLKLIISESDESNCSGGELGHGLGSLTDGVLGKLTWEEEADGCLDLTGGKGVLLVVAHQAGGLGSDLLKDIIDERIHDAH